MPYAFDMPICRTLRFIVGLCFVFTNFRLILGQDRLPTMPGYDQYTKMRTLIAGSVKRGELRGRWIQGGKAFLYTADGEKVLDVATLKIRAASDADSKDRPLTGQNRNVRRRRPDRGRQFAEVFSDDGKWKAFTKDRNAWISAADGKGEIQVTKDGSLSTRIKYATASWVYGEELNQVEAMGWSPDSTKLWFYRFDESKVPDYYVTLSETAVQNTLDVEAYPKAGAPNPQADVMVYDLASRHTVAIDARDGRPFDEGLGHYVYGLRWSNDGKELFFHRTNRWQNVMEFCAANATTGKVRVVIRESNPNGWTDNTPERHYLDEHADISKAPNFRGKMLWISERNGFRNIYLANLDGSSVKPITQHRFEVSSIAKVDLSKNLLFYMAHDGDNPYKLQLHRVNLDGTGEARLTDTALSHNVDISPDNEHLIDIADAADMPPVTRLLDRNGKILLEMARSDMSKFQELALERTERLVFKAADGKTDLYGYIQKPSNFDPSRKYPVIVDIYGGPESGMGRERFSTPNPVTEFGFIVATFEGRGTSGRGRAFKDEMYLKLGRTEIDDEAAGVRALAQKPYVDAPKVGINGVSYGGYSSAMCLLRYPEVFAAASASSSVTDWRNYDTIYTERYMRTPEVNKEGYDAGACMTYAEKMQGRLLLYYGTADNNVHPSNTLQLVRALQRAGKGLEVQVGPDQGHSGVNWFRMMEFFIERLVMGK